MPNPPASSLQIVEPDSVGTIPIIITFGRSGGGKTRSALILARGMVGEKGRIILVDTENKRGSMFRDKIPGGYKVINLDAPFTSERYMEAIKLAENNADIIIVDSMTHEWDGEGGVLEQHEAKLHKLAGDDFGKRERMNMLAWADPKFYHTRLIQTILRCKVPIICCLRAKEKVHMGKKEKGGKSEVWVDENTSPIYDSKFEFEALIAMELKPNEKGEGGFTRITKITHEDLWDAVPKENEQLSYRHGELIMKWCNRHLKKPEGQKSETKASPSVKALKTEIWELTKPIHFEDPKKLEQHLIDENLISDTETVATLTEQRLQQVLEKLKAKKPTNK